MEENKSIDFPALVELFGHTRIAGKVSEHALGGNVMIRIDVPDTKRIPSYTKFVNPSAIYALNPITEEMMQKLAEEIKAKPIESFDLREVQRKLMAEVEEAKKQLPKGQGWPEE